MTADFAGSMIAASHANVVTTQIRLRGPWVLSERGFHVEQFDELIHAFEFRWGRKPEQIYVNPADLHRLHQALWDATPSTSLAAWAADRRYNGAVLVAYPTVPEGEIRGVWKTAVGS